MILKIEFGCGETPHKEDFKTCDIRNLPGIDFVCAAWDINKYVPPNSVSEIYSRHFFEHLTFTQGQTVLDAWYEILMPSGTIEMSVPNMLFHLHQWLDTRNDPKKFAHALAGIWGWQRGEFNDVWDVHKSGYDKQSLYELLKNHKFQNIEIWTSKKSKHLHCKCSK
jgi:predicted SAM-dependent methyltransferase